MNRYLACGWFLGTLLAVLCIFGGILGCAALFGAPAWTEPATYDAAGAMVSGTVEHPATPGIVGGVAAAAEGTGTPWGLIIASALGALTTIVQTVRGAKKVAPKVVVEAADRAQLQVIALKSEPPGSPTRVDIGDIFAHALRSVSAADAKKIEAAFRASRKGK